jgi:TPR repeat protein
VDATLARWDRDTRMGRILRELRRERARCLEGEPEACLQLLPVCGSGERCERQRLHLKRLLCIVGHGPTCDALGEIHQRGLWEITGDKNAAERFYDRACVLGYQGGCLRLATLHRSHRRYFARRDAVERHAHKCRAGSVTDCLEAARGYRTQIKPMDAEAARVYTRLACKLGSTEACARVKKRSSGP